MRFRMTLILVSAMVMVCQPSATKEKPKTPSTVLLLTSPRKQELLNMKLLVKRGLLKVDGLKLIGIYHSDEYTDYSHAYKWLRNHNPGWMEIRRIKCRLEPDKVIKSNDCSRKFKELFDESDGVIFTGGPDIPPSLYGKKTDLATVIEDPPRHRFEISFLHHLLVGDPKSHTEAFMKKKPYYLVLGICLGMQSMNVAMGGTLIQDIPSEVYGIKNLEQAKSMPADKMHRSISAQLDPAPNVGWGVIHPIKILADKLFSQGFKEVKVLSLHHQAIGELAKGLDVWARSKDGKIIEAVSHHDFHHVYGVQFHPEKRVLYDPLRTYLPHANAHGRNFVTDTMKKDHDATEFLKRFWGLISHCLIKSSVRRHAMVKPVR